MKKTVWHSLLLFLFATFSINLKAQVDGLMYSMTYDGDPNLAPFGVINRFDPFINKDTAVVDFLSQNGANGYGNFIQLNNGLLYGTTAYGGNGTGNIIEYNVQTGQNSVLYSLPGDGSIGAYIYGSLCHATDDLLYGLTYYGGTLYNSGVLFSYNYYTGVYSELVQLYDSTTGSYPAGSLIQATDSLLYGFTTDNADYGSPGTIFSYNIYTGDTQKVYTFTGGADGNYPRGNLLLAKNGLLYGLTQNGGTYGDGVLFSFNTHTHTETVLVNFADSNGANPEESLMQASDGNLYGTTALGGIHDSGTLFKYNISTNTEMVLYSFGGSDSNGYYPYGDLIQANDGLLYGCTNGNPPYVSGFNNWGTIFSYDTATHILKTHVYYNDTNGAYPYGDLLEVMSVTYSITNNTCPNDSSGILAINVRGGKWPLTYSWSNGATISSINHLKSGIYFDTVRDARGITFTSADTIKPLPMGLTFKVSNPCYAMDSGSVSVIVSGGIGPFKYLWNNGKTTDTVPGLPVGSYTCTVKDSNGCPVVSTVVITQAPAISITNVAATEQTYPYHNGKITVYASGGIPPGDSVYYHYLWSNGAPYDSSAITNLDSGSYAVCVISPYGCGSVCDSNILVLTGTSDLSNPMLARVYPVPSNGQITINFSGKNLDYIEITDALGRPVYKQFLPSDINDNELQLDLSNQPNGVYILYVHSKGGILTRKILIQR